MKMQLLGNDVIFVIACLNGSAKVENIYTAYNFSHFAIYVPKTIKFSGNLTKFSQKQKCTVFWYTV